MAIIKDSKVKKLETDVVVVGGGGGMVAAVRVRNMGRKWCCWKRLIVLVVPS